MAIADRTRNLTVDEVFTEFRNFLAENALNDDRDAAKLTLETTLGELCGLIAHDLDWEQDFEMHFGLNLPLSWWEQWVPAEKTIGEVCTDLASRIEVPVSQSAVILGRQCETAGMFRVIKKVFADHGADVQNLTPSTPIERFAGSHPLILARLRLAQVGRLPGPVCYSPTRQLGCLVSLGISLSFVVSGLLMSGWQKGLMLGAIPLIAFMLLTSLGFGSTTVVRFPGIVTFRDFIHASFDRPLRQKA